MLLAGVAILATMLAIPALRLAGQPQPGAARAPAQQLQSPPATIAPARATQSQAPGATRPRIALHGVLYRAGGRSQVLLSVDGQPGQPFALGDAVGGGWSVRAIRPEAVVLANGTEQATFGLAAPPASTVAAATSAPAAARRLPGFVAGPAPATDDAQAHERNRRFLDAVQGRLATR